MAGFTSSPRNTANQIRSEEQDHLSHEVLFEVPDPSDSSLVVRTRIGLYAGAQHLETIWVGYTPGILGMLRGCINNRAPQNPYTVGSLARIVAEGCGLARFTASASKGSNQFIYATPGGYILTSNSSQVPGSSPCIEISDSRKAFRTLWPIGPQPVPVPDAL